MIRDKTAALKEALGENDGNGADGEVALQMEIKLTPEQARMDHFLAKVDLVRGDLEKMEHKVSEVQKLHSHILSSSTTEEKTNQQLEDNMAEFKVLATRVKKSINEIAQESQTIDGDNNNANQRIKKTQHSTLSRRFVDVMKEFNIVQTDYGEKCKSRLKRQLDITGRSVTEDELDDMLESGKVEIFTQGIIMETQQAKQQLADIEARHADIVKLENNIRELHDLFMNMAVLVESQGEVVDRIENHVCQAQEYVETAKVETAQAVRYQTKARKKMIMIGVCLAILLLVIIIIIVVSV
ncbi:hypothetical protein Pmani_019466 [Petrolisthes manimaculis]|uniref:t-SNARE coiled-coil homology domain-containing protein n=1 Tax=Petrolisthes manimaculis TaxID=1843537 RepID=A0AAE1U3X4_9EUCA|nr:hypothetical protein Pmani_019466 [Petrolisthes manimaculis]